MQSGANRYDRQTRIAGWNQPALTGARVLIAGAGALGNEIIKNLALLGVGSLLIVDFDRVDVTNLSRSVLFRDGDVTRPKAEAAADAARRLNPELQVRHLSGDLLFDVGLSFYRHSTLVVGALDSIVARSEVGTSCALTGRPFLDTGMWALGGEVRWFLPGETACFECTLTADDRSRAELRRSCTGFRAEDARDGAERGVPATVTTAAVVAGLAAREAANHLAGYAIRGGEALVFNGLRESLHRSTLERDPSCTYHSPYRDVVNLDACAATLRGNELLRRARRDLGDSAVIELGRDFLLALHCPGCGAVEEVRALFGRVEASRAQCPRCGSARDPELVSRLSGEEACGDWPLSELGVPPGEILLAHVGDRRAMYALTGDVAAIWPEHADAARER
jgi:adenylyltransferase/sulfurtransferase